MPTTAYVLHNKTFLERFRSPEDFPLLKKNLLLVATIETSSLEWAFHMTQHIDSNWIANPKIHTLVFNARSTSVSDVIILENPDWLITQRFYEIQNFGFKHYPIPPFDISDLLIAS